jgi:hypothetical protein
MTALGQAIRRECPSYRSLRHEGTNLPQPSLLSVVTKDPQTRPIMTGAYAAHLTQGSAYAAIAYST